MKSIVKTVLFVILSGIVVTSCQTSSDLADSKVFQKRRYTKGYHINLRKPNSRMVSKSVTARAYLEVDTLQSISAKNIEFKTVEGISESAPELLTASNEDATRAIEESHISSKRKKWVKNISWPSLVSEIFAEQPEEVVEQPAPAGAIIGFIAGIVGLFVAGIPLGILAIILCGVAIGKIEKNPGMKGKGIAIAGIVIGAIAVVGALIVISSM